MSDFFSAVHGAQMPEVVWNSGPLPPSGGLPAPLHDTADARINYNSTLLGDLNPYAYGEPGYLSSQTAYLNIPHKLQKMIPLLQLPALNREGTFELSHPVDDGDIAFVLRLDRRSMFCQGINYDSPLRRNGLGAAIDCFINLPTVNYILFGAYTTLHATCKNDNVACWEQFLENLGMDMAQAKKDPWVKTLGMLVRDKIKPFGIVRGSENQGGQSEATNSPVTWTAAFVVNLVIDGKEDNVLNIWHEYELGAGDDLVLRFAEVDPKNVPPSFTLNHYFKKVVRESVHRGWKDAGEICYFLVPDVFTMNLRLDKPNYTDNFLWQCHGFWHVARTQIQCSRYNVAGNIFFDDCTNLLRGVPIEVTFQPMYVHALGKDMQNHKHKRGDGSVASVASKVSGPASLFLEKLVAPAPQPRQLVAPAPQPRQLPPVPLFRAPVFTGGLRVRQSEPVTGSTTLDPTVAEPVKPITVRVATVSDGANSINKQQASRLLSQTSSTVPNPTQTPAKAAGGRKRPVGDTASTKGVLLHDNGNAEPQNARLI